MRVVINKKQTQKTSTLVVCEVDESLKTKLEKFRFRKETTNAAILMKIDMDKHLVILDKEYEDISPDDLREELPERQPRYPSFTWRTFIVYSYKYVHDDRRVSYPLCFIFSSPAGCKPDQQMMYAGSKNELVKTVGLTKVIHAYRFVMSYISELLSVFVVSYSHFECLILCFTLRSLKREVSMR
ncbi:hypothetical protein ABVT39_006208 [Epinephelus coioides]